MRNMQHKKGGKMAKRRMTGHEKAYKKIGEEGKRQCFRLYSAAAIALYRYYDKKQQAITNFFRMSLETWKDCAKDYNSSMIQMCEEETGIEIQNGDGKSWKDLPYLNGSLNPGMMTYEQWTYMRLQQVKWVRPQIMACLLLTLHRKYGFGYERCSRIYGEIQEIEAEYRMDPKKLRKACHEEVGIDVADIVTIGG